MRRHAECRDRFKFPCRGWSCTRKIAGLRYVPVLASTGLEVCSGEPSKNSHLCAPRAFTNPEPPYSPYFQILVPKSIPGIVVETRVLEWEVYGPFEKVT